MCNIFWIRCRGFFYKYRYFRFYDIESYLELLWFEDIDVIYSVIKRIIKYDLINLVFLYNKIIVRGDGV